MRKVAIVTCYKHPDYARAVTLRTALQQIPGYQTIIIKNRHKGLLRYPEVTLKLLWTKLWHKPDIYLITFRGYEILPVVLLFNRHKPVIFDEFINMIEWVVYEHHKLSERNPLAKLLKRWYRWQLSKCSTILTDTPSHAAYSAKLMKLPPVEFVSVPVSAEEELYKPRKTSPKDRFEVLYYGNMLPLHGMPLVLEAARQLKTKPITWHFIGGGSATEALIEAARQDGVDIQYESWVPGPELSQHIDQASLCLGGPFGDTFQSQMVITGKTYHFLASAAPCVVGLNDDTSAAFTDKKDALLVKQGDAKALASAVRWAYDHQSELPKIGRQGRTLYEKQFSNSEVTKLLRRVLADL